MFIVRVFGRSNGLEAPKIAPLAVVRLTTVFRTLFIGVTRAAIARSRMGA